MRPKITNDELVEAVEQEADRRDITNTEAVRLAIRNFCINNIDDDSEENENLSTRTIDLLDDEDMRSVHRTLWRIGSSNGCAEDLRKVPLSSAKSVVAQLMGVSKEVIQEMYIKPLSRKQITDLEFGETSAQLYVVDPDAEIARDDEFTNDTDDNTNITTDDDSSNTVNDADDRLAEVDDAEPVRADGGKNNETI